MKSNWIWVDENQKFDTYGEFYSEFSYDNGRAIVKISVDSNYALYINGQFVDSDQYCDFPYYKVYDEIDITKFCRYGLNKIGVLVWYYGQVNFTYYPGNAGLWYEIHGEEGLLACSNEDVLSRYSRTFKNGYLKSITMMLGLSFLYDTTKEDEWQNGGAPGFAPSVIVKQKPTLHRRRIKKLEILEPAASELIKSNQTYYLFDLQREEVGYLTLKVRSKKKQLLTICYGEHIVDGNVRRRMGHRDFSVEVIVGEGITEYTNYFRRLGLRYLEIHSEDELEIEYATVRPCPYPLKFVDKKFENPLHQKIYDVSVRTLHLCMHEHYEDCPWREQSLYTMDSRNQMLCGYYAFDEYEFPRENLYLWSKDNRSDNLLALCAPTTYDLTIPSFTLHYFTEVYEYTLYSGDLTLAQEIFPKLQSILAVFIGRMKDGLVVNFTEKQHWKFYEWTKGLDGCIGRQEEKIAEAALNCLFSLALQNMQKICDLLNIKADYTKQAERLNTEIRKQFYDEESGLYVNDLTDSRKYELVNAWAVLCGAAKGEEAKRICEILAGENDLAKITLSMSCFLYDALLLVDKERYKDYIIQNIEEKYKRMLDAGATAFWETELGDANEDNSGSLCHGWSAMPIYYFNLLL